MEASIALVRVVFGSVEIARSTGTLRVLETSHPPVYYVPHADIVEDVLRPNDRRTFCEFKGVAAYVDLVVGEEASPAAGWFYPAPAPGYEALLDHVAFYPSRVDACFVGDEQVVAQDGDFYGGWITSDIVGPFKGGPGTLGW